MSTKRPKVLLFFEYGTLNGGEFSMLAMLETLGHEDFEFVGAVPPEGPLTSQLHKLKIPTVPLILRNASDQKRPPEEISAHLIEHILEQSPDLVHANSLSMGRMLGRVAPEVPPPCSCHLRDIIKLSKAAICDLNQNKRLIAVSHATRDFHVNQGLNADKTQVIHNGVNTEKFSPQAQTGTQKTSLGLKPDDMLAVTIGQICLRKGQQQLAQAAILLKETCPHLNYAIVGERYSQKQESIDYENNIQNTFREANISDHLFQLGFQNNIPHILNEADLLIHNAHQEPLGRVLLEAAACGRPIIATDVGGTNEILTHQKTALLIPPNNPQTLSQAIQELLKNQTLRNQLGQEARRTVLESFTIPQAAQNIKVFWETNLMV